MRTAEARIRPRSEQGGFTLIELLVVIIIIAVLAAIAIPTYLGTRGHAQNAAAYTLVRNALTTIQSARINLGSYAAITVAELTATEPSIHWNVAAADLVDPDVPTITASVTAAAADNAIDFYAQSATCFDVACISASGDRYGIQVETTGNAQAEYIRVKSIDGQASIGW